MNVPPIGSPNPTSFANTLMLKLRVEVEGVTNVCSSNPFGWLNSRSAYLEAIQLYIACVCARYGIWYVGSVRLCVGEWTYRCGSDPAGGEGCMKSETAGVWLVRSSTPFRPACCRSKLPPRKWRTWERLGIWGVGASRSSIVTTKGPQPGSAVLPLSRMLKVGGMTVAV